MSKNNGFLAKYLSDSLFVVFRRWSAVLGLVAFALAGCKTVAPNQLSAADTAALKFMSVEARVPEIARIHWPAMEDEYVRSRGYTVGDPRPLQTPEARAYIAEQASRRLKAALERAIADHQGGTRPVRVIATLIAADLPSAGQRILVGGHPTVAADVEIVDARTGATLTSFRGDIGLQLAGQGIGGTLIDAALVAGGMDDLFERAANDVARKFRLWLAPH